MIGELIGQFADSAIAKQAIEAVSQQTDLAPEDAQEAVAATAVGTAELAGGGDLMGNLGSLLGGGDLGSMLGGAGGDALTNKVTGFVAAKTGLPESTAATVVGIVLPKIVEFVEGKEPKDGAGILGGLLK